MEKFAGYGFNKSHSVAYAYISYQTAFLKTYYPSIFLASALSQIWIIQIRYYHSQILVRTWDKNNSTFYK